MLTDWSPTWKSNDLVTVKSILQNKGHGTCCGCKDDRLLGNSRLVISKRSS